MRKKNTNYSLEEKLFIIDFYRKNGIYETERKFNIGNSVVYRWERILIEQGKHELGLEKRGRRPNDATVNNVNEDPDLLKEVQRLRLENAYLKKLKALREEE